MTDDSERDSLSDRMEFADSIKQLSREQFDEAKSEATGKFGIVDDIALNIARADYELAKVRADSVLLGFEDNQANYEMSAKAARDAAEAKYQSRFIAGKIRRLETMVFIIFLVVVGSYFAG